MKKNEIRKTKCETISKHKKENSKRLRLRFFSFWISNLFRISSFGFRISDLKREGSMTGDFLPGKLSIERGTAKDYESLSRFHYIAGRPGTWAGVWVARYQDDLRTALSPGTPACSEHSRTEEGRGGGLAIPTNRVVAIAVLSWSPLGCTARDTVLNLRRFEMKERAKWLNKNVRTISRVVVHPQFRGVGLGSHLVRQILEEAPTRYVETIAAMGKVHPFFEKAGMRRIQHDGEKAYFIFDRGK
jgi:GNAT superfamily N-acetyltransferase